MLVAGIDVGVRNVAAVLLRDSDIISSAVISLSGAGEVASCRALTEALKGTNITLNNIQAIVATGCGRNSVSLTNQRSTEVVCQARGSFYFFPLARTVINLGSESSRSIRLGEAGRVKAFAKNDRCAAGSGLFLETVAKILDISLPTLGLYTETSGGWEEVSSICAVFAESEIISHIHRGVTKERIVAGIHRAVVDRIMQLISRVGINPEIVVTGGVAKNKAIINELETRLKLEVVSPEEPQIVGALGAALIAKEKLHKS